eukprot:TRINITY_DN765_c0_g1_i1.p1 TRINITY_DN765_c0_g1~~TRINITY_DN765_c0_g1_i1.p1  ORF type:complete len:527 (+),score=57.37 TRINITY_DN765_c0_g1_i1:80-1660(+)
MVEFENAAALMDSVLDELEQSNGNFNAQLDTIQTDANHGWLIFLGALVFFMQAGFSLVEAGSARAKCIKNILFKNTMDLVMDTLCFFSFGFAFAFGDKSSGANGFVGTTYFFLQPRTEFVENKGYSFFFFQAMFAVATSTIVGGAVVERVKMSTYVIYNLILSLLIYPIAAHWIWADAGWLSPFHATSTSKLGVIDNAGGLPVHTVGGLSALIGALVIGPRTGLYVNGKRGKLSQASPTSVALGALILWFGWFGFNGGASLSTQPAELNGRVVACTSIAACLGGLTLLTHHRLFHEKTWDLFVTVNGSIAGLIAITPCCHVVDHFGAAIVGIVASEAYNGFNVLITKYTKYDDPVDAGPLHCICGIVGTLLAGLLAQEKYVKQAYGDDTFVGHGLFYGDNGRQFGVQLLGTCAIVVWTGALMYFLFWLLTISIGIRVSKAIEMAGLDAAMHGGQENAEQQRSLWEQFLKHKQPIVHPVPATVPPPKKKNPNRPATPPSKPIPILTASKGTPSLTFSDDIVNRNKHI